MKVFTQVSSDSVFTGDLRRGLIENHESSTWKKMSPMGLFLEERPISGTEGINAHSGSELGREMRRMVFAGGEKKHWVPGRGRT